MSLVLGHSPLDNNDFEEAETLIVEMVLHRLHLHACDATVASATANT